MSTPKLPAQWQLQHASYKCPGLYGPESRMTIRPRSFDWLFSQALPVSPQQAAGAPAGPTTGSAASGSGTTSEVKPRDVKPAPQIIIPLFQRKYCWVKDQLRGWWNDVLQGRRNVPGGHSVGKVIFTRESSQGHDASAACPTDDMLLCVDGQQRITTTQLLMASLRDTALRLSRSFAGLRASAEVVDDDSEQAVALRRHALVIADRIEGVLHRDAAAAREWYTGTARALQAGGVAWNAVHGLGEVLPFSTLLPSFVDRQPYFELLTVGRVAHELIGSAAEGAACVTPQSAATHQGQTKAFFDATIWEYLRSRVTAADNGEPDGGCVEVVRHVCDKALSTMILMFCEIHNKVNLAQVFLWLQEKTLYGMGALLYNPTPGIDFRASDMVRNLLLSVFMDRPHPEQEALYRVHWLEPLEFRHPGPKAMDTMLQAFLETQHTAAEEAWEARQQQRQQRAAPAAGSLGMMPPPSSLSTPEAQHSTGGSPGAAAAVGEGEGAGEGAGKGASESKAGTPSSTRASASKRPRVSAPHTGATLPVSKDFRGRHRFVSAFEKQMVGMVKSQQHGKIRDESVAILLYAQFVSWFEQLKHDLVPETGEEAHTSRGALGKMLLTTTLPMVAEFAAAFSPPPKHPAGVAPGTAPS